MLYKSPLKDSRKTYLVVVWGRQLEVWTAGLGKAFHLRSERKVAQLL